MKARPQASAQDSVGVVVLARSGSRRLPRKVLLPFGEGSVLSSTIQRLRACRRAGEVVLATTDSRADDVVADAGERLGVTVVRGSEDDVVGRMVLALDSFSVRPDIVVRGCADNPLVMPSVVDAAVEELEATGCDVITPFEQATYPFGYGLVAMTTECLARIDRDALAAAYREHVENYCLEHPGEFRVRFQIAPPELDYPQLCTTLDYGLDYSRLLRFLHLLEGVALEDQPVELIARLRSARVWLEGSSEHQRFAPDECDLVVTTDLELAQRNAARASLGALVVDRFHVDSRELYGLRYAGGGDAFPSGPVFLDAQSNTERDAPLEFLARVRERVLPLLLAGPARPLERQESPVAAAAKVVRPDSRGGFSAPGHAAFPPRVAIELADGLAGGPLIEALLNELEREPVTEVVVRGGSSAGTEAFLARATERLGVGRIRRAGEDVGPEAPFAELSIDAEGRLTAAGVRSEADLGACSISSHWTSPAVRRARAEALNAWAEGDA